MKSALLWLMFCVLLCLSGSRLSAQHTFSDLARLSPYQLETEQGMVVCDSPIASRIGRDVFEKGGNAVDAAVATAFAMAVSWPEAGNIGGGGFMIVRPADGKDPVSIDYRETAPLASKVDSFKATDSTLTRKAVGVPGTVRGLELAHKTYGKLKWREVVMPAAKIAKEGFNVDWPLANSTNLVLKSTSGKPAFSELHKVYGKPGGGKWMAGDTMKLPELGATLEEIASKGADAFYKGRIADLLVTEMKKEDGMIRQADLDAYQAKIRKPIIGTFNGFEIIGAAPPSSGGICIVQALNMVEALSAEKKIDNKDRYGAKTMHVLAEVLRRVFLDRARHLGDPDFTEIPDHLTTKEYARKLASEINLDKATSSAALAADIQLTPESNNTTHFSIVDPNGMAVSNTYTLEASWGSRKVVPGAGYVLNNEMGDFNWIKGLTNTRGRIGTAPNLLQPGKRMLSSQCPVIVANDEGLRIVTGSLGGRTIISTSFSIILNHTYFGMSGSESVASARYHHQWMPDRLEVEGFTDQYDLATIDLKKMGHAIVRAGPQGSAHSIFVNGKRKTGIADFRYSGRAASTDVDRIASWEFGENKGSQLTDAVNAGRVESKWSNDIAGVAANGNENLSVRCNASKEPCESFVDLSAASLSSVSVQVHISGMSFDGQDQNEQFRLGFAQAKADPNGSETASLIVERRGNNQIVVRGSALGDGGSEIAAYQLSKKSSCGALVLRMDVNTESDQYSIWIRRSGMNDFDKVGEGKVSADRSVKFLRMAAKNDFSSEGEFMNVDRVEVSKF